MDTSKPTTAATKHEITEEFDVSKRADVQQLRPHALGLMEAIWGPIAQAGKAQLAEFSDDQLTLLLDFLRRGRELQETQAGRVRAMAESAPSPRARRARRSG